MDENINEISFFDNNAFIGKHTNPYTEPLFNAKLLINTITASGVSRSMIYHSAAVSYDPTFGNKLLIDETKNRTELSLVWISVPEHCYTENDTEAFYTEMKKNNIASIKIYPHYHNFTLINGAMDHLLSILNEQEIPLLVNQEEISWEEINYLLGNYNKIPFLLQNVAYQMERFIVPLLDKFKNTYLDITRYYVHDGIEYICNRFGSERLLFGSGMPVFSPEPVMMMINNSRILLRQKQNISSENLLRLLKI